MHKYFSLIPVALLVMVFSCTEQNDDNGVGTINADTLANNISVLASDSFEGRMPFTHGEKMTVDFLQHTFQSEGLQPGNGNSYVQEVPLVNVIAKADPSMQVKTAQGSFSLKAFNDYVIWTDKTDEHITLDKTPVIFAGYGVVAPEYNWNDYEGLDVKGKIVIVMVNDPGFWIGDSTLFKGRTMTYYGRWTYKFEEAARQGAKGCLVIHRTAAAGYPFKVVQNSFNSARVVADNRGKNVSHCDVIGWISDTAATKLLVAAGYDSTLFVKANKKGFKAVPLNLSVSTSMTVKSEYQKSMNVMAKIPGSKRPDEVIIYTAHWDHLGINNMPDETGDSIYNGALDNASGLAGMIEIARAFNSLKTKPERTIVFLAVTAEEQGLLGSAYYAANPVYPVEKTVANINIDGLNNYGLTKDVVIVGLGQSELEDYMKEIVEKDGGYIKPEKTPETGSYFRSDHFNFAKVGIPAHYQGSGIDVVGKGEVYGQKIKDEYISKHYHRPSDEFDPSKWILEGAMRDITLLFKLGKRLAFATTWPQWKAGSEFKAIRDRQMGKK